MTAKPTKKSIYVLLDAVIVIEAHALGIWDSLLDKIRAVVPSTVVQNEAFYFDTKKTGERGPILIKQSVKSGMLSEVAATAFELQRLQNILDYATLQGLDAGETEALALIISGRTEMEDTLFCTADGAAIRALALLGHRESGVSFETLLMKVGLQKPLDQHFREDFFKKHLDRGAQDRITGTGLRK
ncbi:MAG: hypothetical protein KKE57_01115 [Proteobacteria bacterium]|nr:hypothetical protein [Pseudomonadota bacterium]